MKGSAAVVFDWELFWNAFFVAVVGFVLLASDLRFGFDAFFKQADFFARQLAALMVILMAYASLAYARVLPIIF